MNTQQDSEMETLVKDMATRYQAPAELKTRIGFSIRQESDELSLPMSISNRPYSPKWLHMGLAFACGLLVSIGLIRFYPMTVEQDTLSQEIVAGHVRSLMAGHLADVASTDQHTVKPWFAGKLDFSPPVLDLKAEGFPLKGGRLDYLEKRPVAALVYQRRLHTINVFVWPSEAIHSQDLKFSSRQGFTLVSWIVSGMQFWAVSDLTQEELKAFAQLMRLQTDKSTT